jgi:hypothetical protein
LPPRPSFEYPADFDLICIRPTLKVDAPAKLAVATIDGGERPVSLRVPHILIRPRALEQCWLIPRAEVARYLRLGTKRNIVIKVIRGHRPEHEAFGIECEWQS